MANEVAVKHTHDTVLQPRDFGELMQFGKIAASSGMVPRDFVNKPEAVIIAVQMGAELGLSPMQSIQNISVINGRPSVWGDALLALVQNSPLCRDVHETIEGEGDAMTAICTVKRKGRSDVEARFSVADARKANLWTKTGPWQQYPRRMLQMRARGFALRDAFPDVLRGLITVEEAQDYEVVTPQTKKRSEPDNVIDVEDETPRQKAEKMASELQDCVVACKSLQELEKLTGTKKYKIFMERAREVFPDIAGQVDGFVSTSLSAFQSAEAAMDSGEIEEFPEGEAA